MTKAKLPWISFSDSCELMYGSFPEGIDAEQLLGEAIKNGALSVRGKLEVIRGNIFDIETNLASIRRSNTPPITSTFEHSRSKQKPALAHIQIEATWFPYGPGYFVAQSCSDPDLIEVYSDIYIKERDLSSFLSSEFYWSPIGQDGRRRSDDKWLAITCVLIRLERDGRLNNKTFSNAVDLRNEILKTSHNVLDERTIRTSIDAIYSAYVSDFDGMNWKEIRNDDLAFDPLRVIRAVLPRDNSDAAKKSPR